MVGADPIDLYQWMAFGGTAPTYDITVTQEVDGEMMDQPMHGFMLMANDAGIEQLSGSPNLPMGTYNWVLNARDPASKQHKFKTWKLRVAQEDYPGNDITTISSPEDSNLDNAEVVDWADFISDQHDGAALLPANVRGGTAASLSLSAGLDASAVPPVPGMGMVVGNLIKDDADGPDDVDVLWVGPLTPNSVLNVKVNPETELLNKPGEYNVVNVALYSHVTDATKSDAEVPGTSEIEGYKDEYKGLDCGNYYLEVTGDPGGSYTLSWEFTQ
jgi:hypothetical protein